MKKRVVSFLVFLLIFVTVFSFVGCNNDAGGSAAIKITDMEGTEVKIDRPVNKVACLSIPMTDLMIAFGLGDKIVSTYKTFQYSAWIDELCPYAKNYKSYSYSVSAEELYNDGVDLVFLQDERETDRLRAAGFIVVAVHQYSQNGPFYNEMFKMAQIIGTVFPQAKDRAEHWISEVHSAVDDIKSSFLTNGVKNAVYYINGEKPKGLFYSEGGNSMVSTILDIANVQLATEKFSVNNVHQVSDEEIIALNPYAILVGGFFQNKLINELKSSVIWSELDCVKNDRVYRLPVVVIGTENVCAQTPVILKYVANLFNDYSFDFNAELKENIMYYYQYSLSDQDVHNMQNGLSKDGAPMEYEG